MALNTYFIPRFRTRNKNCRGQKFNLRFLRLCPYQRTYAGPRGRMGWRSRAKEAKQQLIAAAAAAAGADRSDVPGVRGRGRVRVRVRARARARPSQA